MGRLDNQIALVTGAASGFGRAIARAFAREGGAVLVADRDGEGAALVADGIAKAGGLAQAAEVDFTDAAGLAEVVAQAEAALGGLSILVANAGIGQRPISPLETPFDEMRRQFEVNAVGAALTCQAALPASRRHGTGASILLTVSGITLLPRPEFLAYGMAKSAASYLMKLLAIDLAPEGIRVNGLFPAISPTAMFADFADGDTSKAGVFAEAMPLGRLVTPEDVAAAAVFLASPTEAGAMTGCALPVDAGRTM